MAVIELFRVTCVPGRRDEWLKRDAAIWTPALARHEGFVSKEVWPSLDRSGPGGDRRALGLAGPVEEFS